MKEFIILLADIVNEVHDILTFLFGGYMTDKELHFWIMGIIGLFIFLVVHFFFQIISKLKWGITILSFIYTFTGMVVLAFAIELQQAITNRGNMEFADAVAGLWGFILFFIAYAILAFIWIGIRNWIYKKAK